MGCVLSSQLSAADAARITSDIVIDRIHQSIHSCTMKGYFQHTFLCDDEIFPHVKQHFESVGYNLSQDPEMYTATISWFPQ